MDGHKAKDTLSILAAVVGALCLFLVLLLGFKWNILICMLLAAALYVAFLFLLKPTDRIGKVDISSLNNGELLHEKLSEAGEDYARLKKATAAVRDTRLQKSCQELLEIADSILKYLTKNPQKIPAARRYIDYYQETAAGITEHYVELQDTRVTPAELQRAYDNTTEAIATLKNAFQMQFEKLMQNEIMDMESDLNLLKQTLNAEGYQNKEETL